MPPRNSTDFLELAENCTFLDRKLINDLIKPWTGTEQLKTEGSRLKAKEVDAWSLSLEFSILSFHL